MGTGLQRVASVLVVMLMWAGFSGCGGSSGGGGGETPGPSTGTGGISGTLRIPGVNATSTIALATVNTSEKDSAPQRDFVPGELLVQLKPGTNDDAALGYLLSKYASFGLRKVGRLYPEGPFRLRTKVFRDTTLPREDAKAKTATVLRSIEAEPSVESVGFNYLEHPQQTTPLPNVRPNDPGYVNGYLWGQRLIDLPNAWGVSTGRSDVVVAVLDTGIRPNHPELSPLLVPGADFVQENGLESSGDGDGIDREPTDLGPFPATGFHGTHVAGTIAAVSNNGKGVSGVAWGVRIMPVRVLGVYGGGFADIVNGMRWAGGLPVEDPSAPPLPANPAKVINMSLAGVGDCRNPTDQRLRAYRNTIEALVAHGISVVVAAGNSGDDTPQAPASCPGVIAVAAVNYKVARSYYSSFQNYVFIAAPGGDVTDVTEGASGGILSTINMSASNQPTYGFYQGTSMAAPHVAGVIALMHSAALDVGKTLSTTEIESILRSTALDLGPSGRDPEYGHGLIQAGAAVYQAKLGTPPTPSVLRPVPDPRPHSLSSYVLPPLLPLNFSTVTLHGSGGNRFFCYEVSPPNEPWLTLIPHDGSYHDISVKFNGSALPNGVHRTDITVRVTASTPGCSGGEEIETLKIPVTLVVGYPELQQRQDTLTVRAFGINPATQKMDKLGETQTSAAAGYRFRIPDLRPGQYYVEAGVDINRSGQFGDAPEEINGKHGDGALPESIEVTTGQSRDIDILIGSGQSIYEFD